MSGSNPPQSPNLGDDRPLRRWGHYLFLGCFGCLTVGGSTINIFFPELKGSGLTPGILAILVPIWTMGVLGVFLLVIAWATRPYSDDTLAYPLQAGSRFALKWGGLLILTLLLSGVILPGSDEWGGEFKEAAIRYVVCVYWAAGIFFAFLFRPQRHRASVTYLNAMWGVVSFFLLPLMWPLLLAFELRDPRFLGQR